MSSDNKQLAHIELAKELASKIMEFSPKEQNDIVLTVVNMVNQQYLAQIGNLDAQIDSIRGFHEEFQKLVKCFDEPLAVASYNPRT